MRPSSLKSAATALMHRPSGLNVPASCVTSANVPSPLLRIERARLTAVAQRTRVSLRGVVRAELAVVVQKVVAHEDVELAVAVVVEPGRVEAPPGVTQSRLSGDVGERAVAVVVVQLVGPVVQDVEIHVAVVVVVRGGAPEPPRLAGGPRLLGDVGEGAVVIVPVQRVPELALQSPAAVVAHVLLPATVGEVDVEPAVAVVVEDAGPASGALDDVVQLGAAVAVGESDARGSGHVDEGGSPARRLGGHQRGRQRGCESPCAKSGLHRPAPSSPPPPHGAP